LDTSFAASVVMQVLSLAVQPDGKILVAGYNDGLANGIALARLNADGSLDSGFHNDFTLVRSVVVQPDGTVLVSATRLNQPNTVFRLNDDVSVDPTFSNPAADN